jgi:hypothetical protein
LAVGEPGTLLADLLSTPMVQARIVLLVAALGLVACETVEPPVMIAPIACAEDCPTDQITTLELNYSDHESVALINPAEVTITLYGYPKQMPDLEATVIAQYKATIARLNASVDLAIPIEPYMAVSPEPLSAEQVGYFYNVVIDSNEYSTDCVVPSMYDAIPDLVTVPVSATPWCPPDAVCACD